MASGDQTHKRYFRKQTRGSSPSYKGTPGETGDCKDTHFRTTELIYCRKEGDEDLVPFIASLDSYDENDEIETVVRSSIENECLYDAEDDCLFGDGFDHTDSVTDLQDFGRNDEKFHDLETDSLLEEDGDITMATSRRHSINSLDGEEDGNIRLPPNRPKGNLRIAFDSDSDNSSDNRKDDDNDDSDDNGNDNDAVDSDDEAVQGAVGGTVKKRQPSVESDDMESRTEEIEGLKKRGILPLDFPGVDGDADKYDENDVAKEIAELLRHGAITKAEAENLQKIQEERKLMNDVTNVELNAGEIILNEFTEDGLPVNWTKQKRSVMYTLVDLSHGDEEYETIKEEFRRENIEVKKVQRLQNIRLLERFKAEMEDIKRHRSTSFHPNIRYLYHGTNGTRERICEEGLDQRLSRMGYFGKGIYFSDNPIKCIHYADDSSNPDEAYILKCRVILGDSKVYAKGCYDTTLKREPEKEDQAHGWRYYDSVVGLPKDHKEFVVYENRRAMIEYIISFHVDRSVIDQQKGASSPQGTTGGGDAEGDDGAPRTDEEQFQTIAEIRENVRKMRMEEKGLVYQPPSQEQINKDREMWLRLQKVHGELPAMFAANNINPLVPPPNMPVYRPVTTRTLEFPTIPQFREPEEDPVEQVLKSCVAEFLTVTGTSDADVAEHYVLKAETDLNVAISMYFEETSGS